MMNILITGGSGFIGSNLALALLQKGYQVTVMDTLSVQIHGKDPVVTSPLYQSISGKVNFIKGDVNKRTDWINALKDQQVIVHFAAETGTGQSMYEIERYTNTNIGGTAILLDLLTNQPHSVKKVVIASSRSIYGEGKYRSPEMGIVYPGHRDADTMNKGDFEVKYPGCTQPLELMPTDETSAIHPSSVYGITKQNQEQMVMLVCQSIGIAAVAFRYQNVYGPGQSLTNPYTGILSIFSSLIKNHRPINIFEDGKESRDFVFIDDVVQATMLGIEKEEANGEIFNVGTGVAIDVLTVAGTLIKKYGIDVPVTVTGNYRLGDISHNYADLTKIKSRLGFNPTVDFESGISRFADWVDGQEVTELGNYARSLDEMKSRGLFK